MFRLVALGVGAFVLAWFIVLTVVGIFGSSNLVWGENNQYGRVDVPGTKVLHLPAREIDVSAAMHILGKGNETVDVPIPDDASVVVRPVTGEATVRIRRDLGDSTNAMDDGVNSQRRVWKIDVPREGDYRVTAAGSFAAAEINTQLWFGHGPPIPGDDVPLVAVLIVLLATPVGVLIARRRRAARGRSAALP
jgi:hypothetical protein